MGGSLQKVKIEKLLKQMVTVSGAGHPIMDQTTRLHTLLQNVKQDAVFAHKYC